MADSTCVCAVCTHAFSEKNGPYKSIECFNPQCDFRACITCHFKYLNDSTKSLHCMNCNFGWTEEFFASQVPKVWMSRYHQSRLEIQTQQAIAMIPEVQNKYSTKIQSFYIRRKIYNLENEMDLLCTLKYEDVKDDDAQVATIARRVLAIQNEIRNLSDQEYAIAYHDRESEPKTYTPHVICGCPIADCRGFIRLEDHTCGICMTPVCSECLELMSESHTCDPNNVKSAKLRKTTSKPCVKCKTPIFKIDGCDQMWCTQCHTAFSWNTGAIETKVHNPHAYEYWRRHGFPENYQPLGHNLCDIQMHNRLMTEIVKIYINGTGKKYDYLMNLLRYMNHYEDLSIRQLERVINSKHTLIEKVVLDYILFMFNKDELKKKIGRLNQKIERMQNYLNIMTTFVTVAHNTILSCIETPDAFETHKEKLVDMMSYLNGELKQLNPKIQFDHEFILKGQHLMISRDILASV